MKQDKWNCFVCCISISESSLTGKSSCITGATSLLENSLDVIFLLRNLLKVPSVQLENQLHKNGDNPESWIRLCSQCTQLTRNARELKQDIKKIEKQLRSIQKQVLGKISNSIAPDVDENGDDVGDSFGGKIRSFVKCFDYSYLNETRHDKSGFLEGDKLAKYLESQQFSTKTIILVEKHFHEAEIKEEVVSPPVSPAAVEDSNYSSEAETVKNAMASHPQVNEQVVYLCDHCGKEFSNEAFLKMHVMKGHKKVTRGKGMTCSLCGHAFYRTKHLHVHLLTKHKDDPITKKLQEETGLFYRTCSVVGCTAQFLKQISEDKHMAKVHPDGSGKNVDNDGKPFKCRFCGRGFWGQFLVNRHERIHEVKGKVKHTTKWRPTNVTEKQVGSPESKITQEMDKPGLLEKRFKCDECGKSWIQAKFWSDHLWNKHDIRDITCPGLECGMVFKNNLAEFQNHWRKKHWGEMGVGGDHKKKKYICKFCGEDKGSYIKLYYHRRSAHLETVEKKGPKFVPVTCTICGKEQRNKYVLERHLKFVHEKQFELKCPLCGLGMRQSGHLKKHLLARHKKDPMAKQLEEEEGLKLLICGVEGCKRSFIKKEGLDKHKEKFHH